MKLTDRIASAEARNARWSQAVQNNEAIIAEMEAIARRHYVSLDTLVKIGAGELRIRANLKAMAK